MDEDDTLPEIEGGRLQALEDAGVGFDPTTQHLDLSKEEKRRTTALMMAIQAYKELIIKEATYLTAAADLARRNEGPALKPATIDAIVIAAFKFDAFIAGGHAPADEEPNLTSPPKLQTNPHA